MEGVSSRSFLVDAVTNNTFSLRSTENAILRVMHQSFNYLLNAQREFIDLNRFNFTNSDLKTGMGRFWLEANADLIEQTSRKAYRVSKFYNKEITLDTMNQNRNIFIKVPLLFIDGVPTFAFTVKARLDKMEIYLQIDKYFLKEPHDYTVLFIHNNGYKEIKSNKYIMDKYGNELPNNFFGNSLKTNDIGGKYFTVIRDATSPVGSSFNTTYLTQKTVNFVADKTTDEIIHSSREIQVSVINFRYIYSMEKEYTTYVKDDGTLGIGTVVIEGKDSDYLDMPVPVENILVLKYSREKDQYLVDNYVTVELHYPNIYTIHDEHLQKDDKYKVFYFYHESGADDIHFMNKLDAYHFLLLFKNTLDQELTGFNAEFFKKIEHLIPDIWQFDYSEIKEKYPYIAAIMKRDPRATSNPNVLNIDPDNCSDGTRVLKVGGEKDKNDDDEILSKENAIDALLKLRERNPDNYQAFFDEFFGYEDGVYCYNHADFFETYHPNHFDYKTYKMREFIKKDPLALRTYLMDQYHTGRKYVLFVKDIDLDSRRRTNNFTEASLEVDRVEFDEECYMFAFRNKDCNFLNLRVFIDGLLYVPKYFLIDREMEYFYIPSSMITDQSWIEIERFEDFRLHEVVDMQVNEPHKIRLIIDGKKTAFDAHVGDLYFVDAETDEYIDPTNFKVEMEIDGAQEDISNKEWCVLSTFTVTLTNEELAGRTVYVKLSKTPYFTSFVTTKTGVTGAYVSPHIKRSPEYFRVFVNGRLAPKTAWSLTEYEKDDWKPRIRLNYQVPAGSVVSFDATPYRYKRVFSLKAVPSNNVVDMATYIDKPIDLHYYDIYLNGRKLSEANVIYISPTKLKLINVHSSCNFEVWQKERGDEYYGFDYDDDSWKTIVDRLLDSDKLTDDDKKIIIDHITDQTIIDGIERKENDNTEKDYFPDIIFPEEDAEMFSFYDEQLVPLRYLDPDIFQFNYAIIKRRYPHIAARMKSDIRARNHPNVLNLNPDLCPEASRVIKIGGAYYDELEAELGKLYEDERFENIHLNPDVFQFSKIMLMTDYPRICGVYVQANNVDKNSYVLRINPDYGNNGKADNILKIPYVSDQPSDNEVGFVNK